MPNSEPVRLSKRVAELARCSRAEAEQYIEGGWVSVDGEVVEEPQRMVAEEAVEIDPDARLEATEPATVLFHKPVGVDFHAAPPLVTPDTHTEGDLSGVRLLQRHFHRLTPLMPLEPEASGLMVLSQDGRVFRRLTEDTARIEQEFIVEVGGADPGPYGLARLSRGMVYNGRTLPPCKVSWQNEIRLRFAIHDVEAGQLRYMCAQIGLEVVAIKRIRIGRVSMGKMPVGEWRYLPVSERF